MEIFRDKIHFLTITLVIAILLGGCKEPTEQSRSAQPRIEVDVITTKKQPVPLVFELPGRTTSFRMAEVRPQVNGIVKKRLFTEGSEVKEGQLLYQIDPATYQAGFDSAKAALARAEAIEHSARLKAERYRTLVKTKAVSEQDQIEMDATWKQAAVDVAAARAALDQARINLEYTRVIAPITGRIGKSLISEGALVTARQSTPLATIQQLDPLYVDVNQSINELLQLKKDLAVGQLQDGGANDSAVTILLEDGSAYSRTGSLEFSDVTVNQSTGTVTLRAIVANPELELLPGMFVRAKLEKGVRQDGILVPAASVSRNSRGQAMVLVVNDQSTVESRIIQTGRNIGDQILVKEGLAAGEKVIVAGLQKVRQGAVVNAVEKQRTDKDQVAMISTAAEKEVE